MEAKLKMGSNSFCTPSIIFVSCSGISSCRTNRESPPPHSLSPAKTIAKISLNLTVPRNHSQRLSLIDSDTPSSPSPLTPFPIAVTYFHHHPPIAPNYYYSHFHRTRSPSWSHPQPQSTSDSDSLTRITPVTTLVSTKTDHKWLHSIRLKFPRVPVQVQ